MAPAAAPSGNLSGAICAIVGTWRQICLPYLPRDGASDITYTITLQGSDRLKLEGVDKGQLRFDSATGTRDSDGFPTQFEKPAEAYNKL